MSYEIRNDGMGFLDNLIEVLEELENENSYLEVDACDVPRSTDRYPYTEEDMVEDFPFGFTYMGESFNITSKHGSEFALDIKQISGDGNAFYKLSFTMNENKQDIKKVWKELLKTIEEDLHLKPSSRYFFDLWCERQNIGERFFQQKVKKAAMDSLYQQLTEFIEPEEIEKSLEERYKEGRNISDSRISDRVSQLTKVQFHQFLQGRLYIVYSDGEVFVLQTLDEALNKYEEEHIRRLKELIGDEIKEFNRRKSF